MCGKQENRSQRLEKTVDQRLQIEHIPQYPIPNVYLSNVAKPIINVYHVGMVYNTTSEIGDVRDFAMTFCHDLLHPSN